MLRYPVSTTAIPDQGSLSLKRPDSPRIQLTCEPITSPTWLVYTDLFFSQFVFVNNESTFAALRYDHFIANFKAELKYITQL